MVSHGFAYQLMYTSVHLFQEQCAHGHNSVIEFCQSVALLFGTVYLRHCVLLTIIKSSAGL